MIRDIWIWWIAQLADCVPQRWRKLGRSRPDALVISPVGPVGSNVSEISVSVRRKDRETLLGLFGVPPHELALVPRPVGLPVILRLPGAEVLCKTVTLPLATERDLAQVLAFEMDRETPFSVEDVYWAYRIVNRSKQREQLSVRLQLVPRATLAPLLAAMAETGIRLKQAEIDGGPDDGMNLPLDSDRDQRQQEIATHALRWSTAVICALLAVAAVAIPFVQQAMNLESLGREIAAGRGGAGEAEQLRREIDRLAGAGDVIGSERAAAGDPLATLAALTSLLPDDTYLTELQQLKHTVTFGGRSGAASRLIGAIAASSQLHNPAFTAPVTRIEGTRSEVFTISAEVGP